MKGLREKLASSARNGREGEIKRHRELYDSLLLKKRKLWGEIQEFMKKEREERSSNRFEFAFDDDKTAIDLVGEAEYALIKRKNEELLKVEDTLRRIEEGTYGRCLDCGKNIPGKRLELMPEAVRCTECQSKLEQKGFRPRQR